MFVTVLCSENLPIHYQLADYKFSYDLYSWCFCRSRLKLVNKEMKELKYAMCQKIYFMFTISSSFTYKIALNSTGIKDKIFINKVIQYSLMFFTDYAHIRLGLDVSLTHTSRDHSLDCNHITFIYPFYPLPYYECLAALL